MKFSLLKIFWNSIIQIFQCQIYHSLIYLHLYYYQTTMNILFNINKLTNNLKTLKKYDTNIRKDKIKNKIFDLINTQFFVLFYHRIQIYPIHYKMNLKTNIMNIWYVWLSKMSYIKIHSLKKYIILRNFLI